MICTVLFFVVFRPAVGGVFGKISATEILPEDVEVTFDDVRGCEEAKQELQANILKNIFFDVTKVNFRLAGDRRIPHEPGEVFGARWEAP